MRTFSLLKGKPVFDNGGELIGEVCDICIGEDGLVTDLLLLGKGLIGKKYRLPIQSVTSFGNDGVMIDSKNSLVKYYELHDEYTMHHNQPLAKKNTLSQQGDKLGLLDDVYFMEEVGTIVGYELTDGFFGYYRGKACHSHVTPSKNRKGRHDRVGKKSTRWKSP